MMTNITDLTKKYDYQHIGEQNPYVKQVKNLVSNSKPNPEKLFIAEGLWAFKKLIEHNATIRSIMVCEEHVHTQDAIMAIDALSKKTAFKFAVSAKTYEKLSERDKPDGMLAIAELPRRDIKDFTFVGKGIILVLDGIEIPGNIGTMVRMADGAGIDAIFICNRKARLTHPKLIKGSMGAILSVPIFEFNDIQECYNWLNQNNFTIYLTDTRAKKHYYEEEFNKNAAIVMGSERYGISREWYGYNVELISIPMLGSVDSLNVGVAATVIANEATIKNKLNFKR